ncbi:hypothetical protein ACVB8X_43945, partial [Streptomyces sp. NRAIS4]
SAVAGLLLAELGGGTPAEPLIDQEVRKLGDMLATSSGEEQQRVAKHLRALLAGISADAGDGAQGGKRQGTRERLEAATTAEEIFQMIDVDLGDE